MKLWLKCMKTILSTDGCQSNIIAPILFFGSQIKKWNKCQYIKCDACWQICSLLTLLFTPICSFLNQSRVCRCFFKIIASKSMTISISSFLFHIKSSNIDDICNNYNLQDWLYFKNVLQLQPWDLELLSLCH